MTARLAAVLGACALALGLGSLAPISRTSHAADAKPAKLKVLFLSGGGWHDYPKLSPYLTQKISELVNVEFDVKQGSPDQGKLPEILKDPHLGEGYDAIVYDLCYSADGHPKEEDYTNVMNVTKAGKPTVLVHCAMHCFRPAAAWAQFAGMRTNHHENFGPFGVHAADKNDPITVGWPDDWKTKGDELYVTEETYPDTKPLLVAVSPHEKDAKGQPKEDVVAWQHLYGKGRVFGTTLGHDMTTAADPHYVELLANGLLWACDKLDKDGKPLPGYGAK